MGESESGDAKIAHEDNAKMVATTTIDAAEASDEEDHTASSTFDPQTITIIPLTTTTTSQIHGNKSVTGNVDAAATRGVGVGGGEDEECAGAFPSSSTPSALLVQHCRLLRSVKGGVVSVDVQPIAGLDSSFECGAKNEMRSGGGGGDDNEDGLTPSSHCSQYAESVRILRGMARCDGSSSCGASSAESEIDWIRDFVTPNGKPILSSIISTMTSQLETLKIIEKLMRAGSDPSRACRTHGRNMLHYVAKRKWRHDNSRRRSGGGGGGEENNNGAYDDYDDITNSTSGNSNYSSSSSYISGLRTTRRPTKSTSTQPAASFFDRVIRLLTTHHRRCRSLPAAATAAMLCQQSSRDGNTPLMDAIVAHNVTCARSILRMNVSWKLRVEMLAKKDKHGYTALHHAVDLGFYELIKLFFEQPHNNYHHHNVKTTVDVNSHDNCGNTPLHIAAHRNCVASIKLLLSYSADVDSTNKAGRTPLFKAIEGNCSQAFELLIANDANIHHYDHTNITAMSLWNSSTENNKFNTENVNNSNISNDDRQPPNTGQGLTCIQPKPPTALYSENCHQIPGRIILSSPIHTKILTHHPHQPQQQLYSHSPLTSPSSSFCGIVQTPLSSQFIANSYESNAQQYSHHQNVQMNEMRSNKRRLECLPIASSNTANNRYKPQVNSPNHMALYPNMNQKQHISQPGASNVSFESTDLVCGQHITPFASINSKNFTHGTYRGGDNEYYAPSFGKRIASADTSYASNNQSSMAVKRFKSSTDVYQENHKRNSPLFNVFDDVKCQDKSIKNDSRILANENHHDSASISPIQ